MRFDKGVVLYAMDPIVEEALDRIDAVHRLTVGRDAIMTSARDGEHMDGSLHYVGRAVDFRTRDLSTTDAVRLADALTNELGAAWDIVLESTHVHVELDPD